MDSQLRKEITEVILRRAVIDAHEQDMAEFPPDEELAKIYKFSEAHEARMRALFRRVRRREIFGKMYTVSKRAAIIVLIMATVSFGILLTDSRVQASVRETVISWYERFTLFRFRGNGAIDDADEWFPAYVPSGFYANEIINMYIGRFIILKNPAGDYIVFNYRPAEGTIAGIDNEYTRLETLTLDGIDYFVVTPLPGSEHHSQVIWRMNGYVFLLLSHLDAETLLEMAVSVAPVS